MEFAKKYFDDLKDALDKIDQDKVQAVADVLYNAYKNNQQLFVLGNGGSASTASHFACDLNKGTLERFYDRGEKRFRTISLTDNVATMTAFGNDLSYDDIFAQQLHNLVNRNDVVVAISGSGNSRNVIKAVNLAKELEARTIGLLGFDGGILKEMVDYSIIVPSNHYGIIEDIHMSLTHMLSCYLAEKKKQRCEP
ncbi:MAG: SIS domain-containing protein [archaeon]|nr:SIS domain-containing protein [archaeon]